MGGGKKRFVPESAWEGKNGLSQNLRWRRKEEKKRFVPESTWEGKKGLSQNLRGRRKKKVCPRICVGGKNLFVPESASEKKRYQKPSQYSQLSGCKKRPKATTTLSLPPSLILKINNKTTSKAKMTCQRSENQIKPLLFINMYT